MILMILVIWIIRIIRMVIIMFVMMLMVIDQLISYHNWANQPHIDDNGDRPKLRMTTKMTNANNNGEGDKEWTKFDS